MTNFKIIFLFLFFVFVNSKNYCIDGFYEENGLCWACPENCETCDGKNEDSCTRCPRHSRRWGLTFEDLKDGKSFLCSLKNQEGMVSIKESESRCSRGKFFDEEIQTCVPCHATCRTCRGYGPQNCSSCFKGSFADSGNMDSVGLKTFSCKSRCHTVGRKLGEFSECPLVLERKIRKSLNLNSFSFLCDSGEFFDDFKCRPCPDYCRTCDKNGCLSCAPDAFREVYLDELKSKFVKCVRNCSHGISVADIDGSKVCLMKKPCEKGFYRDDKYNCLPCNFDCETCENSQNCISYKCHFSCKTCKGLSSDQCTSCVEGYLRKNNSYYSNPEVFQCVSTCPTDHYSSNGYCNPCHYSCRTCSGPTNLDCKSCKYDKILVPVGYGRNETRCDYRSRLNYLYTTPGYGRQYYDYSYPRYPSWLETKIELSDMLTIIGILLASIFGLQIFIYVVFRIRKYIKSKKINYQPIQHSSSEDTPKPPEESNPIQNI